MVPLNEQYDPINYTEMSSWLDHIIDIIDRYGSPIRSFIYLFAFALMRI